MTTLVELIPVLLEKSRAGKIEWEQLSSSSFIARIGDLIVEAASTQADTVIRLRSETNVVESVGYQKTNPPEDQMILDLYEIARRKGLSIDNTLENLKNVLDSL
jgi:hypothetical protein